MDGPQYSLGGRQSKPDPRNWPMRLSLRAVDDIFPHGIPEGARYVRSDTILNQGRTGTCVPHAGTGHLLDGPMMQGLPVGYTPFDLYRDTVKIDPWTDNDHEAAAPDDQLQGGTDVHSCLKVLQTKGFIKFYVQAITVEDVRAWHLSGKGGCWLGVPWSDDMFETDADGFIHYTGAVQGWHSVRTTGWNDFTKYRGSRVPALRVPNNWGEQ